MAKNGQHSPAHELSAVTWRGEILDEVPASYDTVSPARLDKHQIRRTFQMRLAIACYDSLFQLRHSE